MNRVALVVGVNTYSHFNKLSAPAEDAEAIAQRLEQDGEFKVIRLPEALSRDAEGDRTPKVGKRAEVTQAELEQALKQLFKSNSPQAPDTALFYFSGHGLRDADGPDGLDKGYLATSETNSKQSRPGLSLAWLQNLLARSPIKNQIVWLDCCHSGGLLIDVASANPGHSNHHIRCFISSSRDFEESWQDLNSPYSVLTKALLDGLDPARVGQRWVDSFSLADYVNQALKGDLQSPICTNFGDAIDLTRDWQPETTADASTTEGTDICPYKGLSYFDCNDEDPKYFFGREALTDQLLDHVRQQSFLAIVGASGSGKSSVLRAGLLHQLKRGRRLLGSDQWEVRIMLPGENPLQNLALAFVDEELPKLDRAEQVGKAERLIEAGADGLRRLVSTSDVPKVVLVVDQFEEVFTLCQDSAEREEFFSVLLGALEAMPEQLCLVVAMRSDFVGKCFEQDYSGLAQRVQANLVAVTPMNRDELTDAILEPTKRVNLSVEPELVKELLDDVEKSPGNLPLLQYTLRELWNQRQENRLQLKTYAQLGGVTGTLQQRADAVYGALDETQQATARHVFLNLTQLGEGTEDTRRRVLKQSLVTSQHSQPVVDGVVQRLADENLVVTSELVGKGAEAQRLAVVDVAHEALIRHWPRLRRWLDEDRDLLRQQRKIEQAAQDWELLGKVVSQLMEGRQLADTERFQAKHGEAYPLSESAAQFVKRSQRRRRINRAKLASWLVIPALAIGLITDISLRNNRVDQLRQVIEGESSTHERRAVITLVEGCDKPIPLPRPLAEIAFGTCRSLEYAPLQEANLSSANLRRANLSSADLRSADLRSADLRSAD
ncbi:MAG: caspase family protein, partial [Elainellaceae cyanobacterium]